MRRIARSFVMGSAALGLSAAALLGQVPPAAAASGCQTAASDFDRDGTPDVAVGAPGAPGRGGAVRVRLSNEGKPVTATLTGVRGFGTAVTTLSSYAGRGNQELCSQLVVGSPDESDSTDRERSGAVHVYYWRNGHFASRGSFHPQAQGVGGTNQSGARFGAALAAEQHSANAIHPRSRLWVGAPGFDLADGEVPGARDAGRVTSFWIDDDEDPLGHDTETFDYGDDFAPGRPTTGGRLGSFLSVDGGLVAMGAPGQTAQGVVGAGTVLVALDDPGPDDFTVEELSQATRGVPGAPEKGDRFGASVHLVAQPAQAPTLLVGAPGEDLGRNPDAGMVTVARVSLTSGQPVGTVRAFDQDSPGMAGSAEAGDALGSSVSSARHRGRLVFLAGSPGETVGTARNAGMVQTLGTGDGWTQQSPGIPGGAEAGDRMGASLGGSVSSRPVVGIPGEDEATGAVLVGLPGDGPSVTYLRGTTKGGRFGFSFSP
jgi:hypothetical protein